MKLLGSPRFDWPDAEGGVITLTLPSGEWATNGVGVSRSVDDWGLRSSRASFSSSSSSGEESGAVKKAVPCDESEFGSEALVDAAALRRGSCIWRMSYCHSRTVLAWDLSVTWAPDLGTTRTTR